MTNTWYDLADHFCARRNSLPYDKNEFFEQFSIRRYNYAQTNDTKSVRLIFLKGIASDPTNRTLVRNGRFIWCKNLCYEGKNSENYRQISFTIGKGKKRFTVPENLVLCIPSTIYINNNSFMRNYDKIFSAFSSVFRYEKALKLMLRNSSYSSLDELVSRVEADNPYKPGSLVSAKMGYFMPHRDRLTEKMHELAQKYCEQRFCSDKYSDLIKLLTHYHHLPSNENSTELISDFFEWSKADTDSDHPYGIILGDTRETSGYAGRELYRVNFGGTIYEKVHPVQMEVVS